MAHGLTPGTLPTPICESGVSIVNPCIFFLKAEIESVYVDMSEAAHRSMNKYFGPIRQFSEHSENSIRRIIKNPTGLRNPV